MAKETVNPQLRSFETLTDLHYFETGDGHEPALLINPAATNRVLVTALARRLLTMHESLENWRSTPDEGYGGTASGLASTLLPLAEEMTELCDALLKRPD